MADMEPTHTPELVDTPRLARIRERLAAYRPAMESPTTNQAVADMQYLVSVIDDQRLTELVLRGEIRRGEGALATFEQVAEQRDLYAAWVRSATECEWDEHCWLDHHGDCQAHGYEAACLIPVIRNHFRAEEAHRG